MIIPIHFGRSLLGITRALSGVTLRPQMHAGDVIGISIEMGDGITVDKLVSTLLLVTGFACLESRDDLTGHTHALTLFDQSEVLLGAGGNETHRDTAFTCASRSAYPMHIFGG